MAWQPVVADTPGSGAIQRGERKTTEWPERCVIGSETVACGKSVLNTRGVHTPAVSKRASQGSTIVGPAGERMESPIMVLSDDVRTLVTMTGW